MAKRVTAAQLDRWRQIEAQRKDLAAKVKALDTEAKQIAKAASDDLAATGKQSAKRGDYLLTWKMGRASVAWKGEFIRVAGAEAAEKLANEAPPTRSLQITFPTGKDAAKCPGSKTS